MATEIQELIRRLATENPRWGDIRILGELGKLGYTVSRQTVRRYRREVIARPPSLRYLSDRLYGLPISAHSSATTRYGTRDGISDAI